ncbi:HD domain-containing protein [Patescibacteria group bacterium]|nr:HD domain-containing protein [Patescibacteria group bacterium]
MQTIRKISDLKIGHKVILSERQSRLTKLPRKFTISSQDEIFKLSSAKFDSVHINTVRSVAKKNIRDKTSQATSEKKKPKNPEERAKLIHQESISVSRELFKNPNLEAIKNAKNAANIIAQYIKQDEQVAMQLLALNGYDYTTHGHSVRTALVATCFAQFHLKCSNSELSELAIGFFLHDIGKTKVDPNILNKPDKLTDEEMELMKKHSLLSYRILEKTPSFSKICGIIALQHHERNDGTGYPMGITGDRISEPAKICTLADIYDALTSKRSYKAAMKPADALLLMRTKMIGHFDRNLFIKFITMFSPKAHLSP